MATGTFTVGGTGYTFEVLSPSVGLRQESATTTRHIPGGNNSYVDLGGQKPRRLPYAIYCTATEFTNLLARVGQQGTLVTTLDGTSGAVLLNLSRSTTWPDGAKEATAEFELT